jgi:hypothetical protein
MRTMLGIRAYGLAQGQRSENLSRLNSLESRILGIRAAAIVIPTALGISVLERADVLFGEIQELKSIAESGTPNVAEQGRLITRLMMLPGEVDLLERRLREAAEEAALLARGGGPGTPPGGVPPPQPPEGLAAMGFAAGLAAMVGLGIWAAS